MPEAEARPPSAPSVGALRTGGAVGASGAAMILFAYLFPELAAQVGNGGFVALLAAAAAVAAGTGKIARNISSRDEAVFHEETPDATWRPRGTEMMWWLAGKALVLVLAIPLVACAAQAWPPAIAVGDSSIRTCEKMVNDVCVEGYREVRGGHLSTAGAQVLATPVRMAKSVLYAWLGVAPTATPADGE